jgi:hypothetical protein
LVWQGAAKHGKTWVAAMWRHGEAWRCAAGRSGAMRGKARISFIGRWEEKRMSSKSRRKGCRGELEAAAELRRLFGVEARRGRQYQGCDDAPDVQAGIVGVHFEVKRVEALRLYPSLEQAIEDAGANVPVVLHRASQEPWVAIVRLDDLPRLATQLYLTLAENA